MRPVPSLPIWGRIPLRSLARRHSRKSLMSERRPDGLTTLSGALEVRGGGNRAGRRSRRVSSGAQAGKGHGHKDATQAHQGATGRQERTRRAGPWRSRGSAATAAAQTTSAGSARSRAAPSGRLRRRHAVGRASCVSNRGYTTGGGGSRAGRTDREPGRRDDMALALALEVDGHPERDLDALWRPERPIDALFCPATTPKGQPRDAKGKGRGAGPDGPRAAESDPSRRAGRPGRASPPR